MTTLHLFKLCRLVEQRPGIYLDDERSLKRLRSFLVGYEAGNSREVEVIGGEDFRHFSKWVADRLGYSSDSRGWCNMILQKAGSDEKAFQLFFKLLGEFEHRKDKQ